MPQANRSQPAYSGLKQDPLAKWHLILAEAEGGRAVVTLFANADAAFAACATLLYVAGPESDLELLYQLDQLGVGAFRALPDVSSALRDFGDHLEEATMETRVYTSGTADFIGKVAAVAARYGVEFASIQTEHQGLQAKRVQCVHCKAIEEQVVEDTVRCSRCKLMLLVRDHYSFRHNAFMGVSRDAEEPVL